MLIDYILEHNEEIIDIFEKHGASNVKIIGSVRRREERDNSDIDFVANLKRIENGETDLQAYMDLINELKTYFNRKIDLADYEQINKQYWTALSNGISLTR